MVVLPQDGRRVWHGGTMRSGANGPVAGEGGGLAKGEAGAACAPRRERENTRQPSAGPRAQEGSLAHVPFRVWVGPLALSTTEATVNCGWSGEGTGRGRFHASGLCSGSACHARYGARGVGRPGRWERLNVADLGAGVAAESAAFTLAARASRAARERDAEPGNKQHCGKARAEVRALANQVEPPIFPNC